MEGAVQEIAGVVLTAVSGPAAPTPLILTLLTGDRFGASGVIGAGTIGSRRPTDTVWSRGVGVGLPGATNAEWAVKSIPRHSFQRVVTSGRE